MDVDRLVDDSELCRARRCVAGKVDGLAPFLEKYNIIIDSKK